MVWDWVIGHGSCGSRVSWLMGHVGHGSQNVTNCQLWSQVISVSENPQARSPDVLFSFKKLTIFSRWPQNTGRQRRWLFHCQNKTNKTVRCGYIFIFCSHYYRSKANLPVTSLARAEDLPARSFDLARPGVAPPLIGMDPSPLAE